MMTPPYRFFFGNPFMNRRPWYSSVNLRSFFDIPNVLPEDYVLHPDYAYCMTHSLVWTNCFLLFVSRYLFYDGRRKARHT